mmetsp:Transcript_18845/g.21051  ORF Transcript_18845/g.21051 Transcript_18845/m.21051 type:complete len:582 (+) Transcript_18845:33-1778(+)|eukprot:CAMPEP_0205824188 /NCGR_PEP_ID=MMETSP0206-20130828/19875_1 /ASSEMBLY_ACC=CAM_ASM_000279 /TAXON_ID=36767 /ORGANISM="Euplotes focardii, Strain TN1" /LENGTH=581 /DNA_ID=CAMNT_0053122083 /DNA_START=33 /DNA_END=1778 /DNA_ORIENTATION=-
MADVSFSEKVADLYQKVSGAFTVACGLLPGGRFQLATQNVRGVPLRVWKNLPATLIDYIRPWFKLYAGREWLVYEGERITFGEAERQFNAIAAELASTFNVQPGDRVGICMRNLPELLIAFLAVISMGGVAVPLNSLWKSEELEYAVTDSSCKVLIADPKRLELAQSFVAKLGIQTILVRSTEAEATEARASGVAVWADVMAAGDAKPTVSINLEAEDEAMIMYTSGSTGFPKGVCHTQRSVGTALKIGEVVGAVLPEADSKALMAVPLFHITALSPIALASIPNGSAVVMMFKWDAGTALDLIAKEKVTRFTGVPTMVRDMLEHPDFDPEKIASLKNMLAGGAPVPPSQVAKMRKKAKKIKSGQGYGLTETMAYATAITGTDYLQHPTSCGRPLPLIVEIKIKDPTTGKVMKDGERGEVCIKSALVMKSYYNKPEATAKAIDDEGFFRTGDVGKIVGGFVYLLDRLKDLIIRGGENIDCSEVEAALATNPAVREVSVFGLPDERLGEVVGACLWVQGDVTAEELRESAAKSLAKFKVPKLENIWLVSQPLPKGATGKIDKKGLRAAYSKEVEMRLPHAKL